MIYKNSISLFVLSLILFFTIEVGAQNRDSVQFKSLLDLSIEELQNIRIISASKTEEDPQIAPASVIVITAEEITQRGYKDLTELFNDLPGIDVSQTFGDLYIKPYWRGMRKGIPSPFLLMIDNMVMNHLWFNWTDVMTAIPLSNIKQIEVVFGPSSSIYGANALMGVINIITINDLEQNGSFVNGKIASGSFDTRVIDMTYFVKKDDFRFSLSAFYNHGDLDANSLDQYEYTNLNYLKDHQLWGNFTNNSDIAGVASSPRNNKSILLNTYFKNIEVGFHYFISDNGYGINYAFDRVQPSASWVEPDLNIFAKHHHSFSEKLKLKSLIRYRESNISNQSSTLETVSDYGQRRLISFKYWQSLNNSISLVEDIEWYIYDNILLNAGIEFDHKNLQKAYDLPQGEVANPLLVDINTYQFPEQPVSNTKKENRAIWTTESLYLQSRIELDKYLNTTSKHNLHLGTRLSNNSYYGTNLVFRAGYIFQPGKFTFKLLYGESFQEPTPRQLYGGWAGSGSSSKLKPEFSQTIETYLGYTSKRFSVIINPFYNKIRDVIQDLEFRPENLSNMHMLGFDLRLNHMYEIKKDQILKSFFYYSFISTKENKYGQDHELLNTGYIGDIAPHKVHFGITGTLKKYSITLLGRYIGDRKTVSSNPIPSVDSWFTLDLNLYAKNVFVDGLGFSCKVGNLLNTQYSHPGIREANAGITPGFMIEDQWFGSKGWSNSLLPQPGRSIHFSILFSLKE